MQLLRVTQHSWLDFAPVLSGPQGKRKGRIGHAFLVLLFLAFSLPDAKAITVWIDTDISIGSPLREVDDAFALVLALRSPNLHIAGISTTYGNASLRTSTMVATKLVDQVIRPAERPPIHPGARSSKDIGRESEATLGLQQVLRQDRGLVYIALGPLTNLATFQILHPDLARKITRVIFLGGRTKGTTLRFGSTHPIRIHDANVIKDPAAARILLQGKIPATLVPIEASAALMLKADDLDAMGRSGDTGKFLQTHSRMWLWFWTKFVGHTGAPIFDAAAVLAAARPDFFFLDAGYAGLNSLDDLAVSPERIPGARKITYCSRMRPGALEFVTATLRGKTR